MRFLLLVPFLLLLLLLPSCSSLGILENDYVEADLGYYTPSTAFDPGARFGAFISQARPKITVEK